MISDEGLGRKKPEWIPSDEELSIALGLPVDEDLITESERKCVTIAQKKLLDYLIANPDFKPPLSRKGVYTGKLEAMKAQLEAQQDYLKAQLRKADEDWVKWGISRCDTTWHNGYGHTKRCCLECWMDREQEIRL